jgi:hypothetical protein
MMDVNWLAIILCGVAYMILGSLWYSPLLFSKPWQKLSGVKMGGSSKQGGLMQMMAISFVASLVMAYVMSVIFKAINPATVMDGMIGGFWIWLGFVASTTVINGVYLKKPYQLMAIEAGFFLVDLLAFGAILTLLR